MSNIVKSKITGLLRGLFRRFDNRDATNVAPPRPVAFAAGAPARTATPAVAPQPRPQPVPAPSAASLGDLQLPLSSVIPVLPMDLRAKLLMPTPPPNATVIIPVEKALSQLAHGSVRISFGELCSSFPGLFDQSGNNDERQIVLPLNEIISRINPALLSRRAAKKIEVADDIAGPFSARTAGTGFAPAQTPVKAPAMTPPKTPGLAHASSVLTPAASAVTVFPKPAMNPLPPAPAPAAETAYVPSKPVPFSPASANPAAGLSDLQLPLSSIIPVLTVDLRAKLHSQTPPVDAFFSIPVEKVLPQLAHGSVKISFGELRAALPRLFDHSAENDARQIVLPLNEIISRINPALLSRRAVKQIEVADDIAGPFSARTSDTAAQAPVNAAPMLAPKVPLSVSQSPAATAAADVNSTPIIPFAALPVSTEISLLAPLAALVEKWPDAIKMELVQADRMRAQAALPSSLVELGLKRGRVTVPWKNLRTMIRPNPLPVSVHDGVELELPLKVLAPLFFAGQKAAGAVNQKTSVLAEIPDLFQDSKKVEAVKPPAHLPRGITMPTGSSQAQMPASRGEPVPAPTLSAAVDAKADGANVFSKAQTLKAAGSEPEASGSDFKPPSATPRDIVARTLALPGVAGAVIALYDGLMIASEVPPGFNADTAAAFLPQIFDRVSHNTRELHMGMLNKLEFTVGDVSWQIFRVNAIYFAAFSRAGEPLPMAQIALLAGELDRRKE